MTPLAVVGAGNIGTMIAELLGTSGSYQLTLIDSDAARLEALADRPGVTKTKTIAADDVPSLTRALEDHFAVINAAPFNFTESIAQAAVAANVHYLDLTEDVAATRAITKLAEQSNRALIPQCGLAPGFVSIAGFALAQEFDQLESLGLRVGALPQYPANALGYNLTWSTEGLINEYLRPCDAIVNGELVQVPPLEELETLSLDGIAYEAFNTSGGLGSLAQTLAGKVRQLNYRSIRYPGHRDVAKLLIQDLGLGQKPELLKEVLETALPATVQDVIVIFITASGYVDGRLMQRSYANRIYPQEIGGRTWAGIQLTTAAAVCAALDLLHESKLPQSGLVNQEDIPFDEFLNNRFGRIYASSGGEN